MATLLCEWFVDWLEEQREWMKTWITVFPSPVVCSEVLARFLMGVRPCVHTMNFKVLAQKIAYSTLTRGCPIITLYITQRWVLYERTDEQMDKWMGGWVDGCLWVQGALATLDVVLIGVWLQRELGSSYKKPDDPAMQTVIHLVAPTLIGVVSTAFPCTLQLPLQGISLGCQIHDTALSTRGLSSEQRLIRWSEDGPVYICIGIGIAWMGTHVWWVLTGAFVQGACNMITAIATFQPMHVDNQNSMTKQRWTSCIVWPYGFTYQVVERMRRIVLSGALSPSLAPKTPLAIIVLRIYARLQRIMGLLPMGLVQSEIYHVIGELITPDLIEDTLSKINDLLLASKSPLKRLSTRQLPATTAMFTGLPENMLSAIGYIVSDQTSLMVIRDIQRQLARRLSDVKSEHPLSFAEWINLGIQPEKIVQWDLNVTLSDSTWVDITSSMAPSHRSAWMISSGEQNHWVEKGATAFHRKTEFNPHP